MNDQELLTYAAKAIDLKWLSYHHLKGLCCRDDNHGGLIEYYWDPLFNDADAFQLMVKLNIEIRFNDKSVSASSTLGAWEEDSFTHETKESTVRKMITCAAAEIGKGM